MPNAALSRAISPWTRWGPATLRCGTRSSASAPDAHTPRSSPSIAARRSRSTISTEAGGIAEPRYSSRKFAATLCLVTTTATNTSLANSTATGWATIRRAAVPYDGPRHRQAHALGAETSGNQAPGWASLITLLSDTAYHSFIGEVEALNTTTICRLTPSRRHQLLAIAPLPPASTASSPTLCINVLRRTLHHNHCS